MLETDDYVDWIARHLQTAWVIHPVVREIVEARVRIHIAGAWPGLAAWLSQPGNASWQNMLTGVLTDRRPVPDKEEFLKGSPHKKGVVQLMRDKYIERSLTTLNQQLANPDLSDADKLACMTKLQELRKLRQQRVLDS